MYFGCSEALEGMSELLRESEVANRLCCSRALLRKWRRVGMGPRSLKIARMVRYRLSDIEVFLSAHEQAPRQPGRAAGGEVGHACLQ